MILKNKEKIEKIKLEEDNYFVAIDFDKTITSNESCDSWAASANQKILGDKIVEELDRLFEIYSPIELNYTIDIKEKRKNMVEWYDKCMDLYYKYALTKEKLEKSINNSNIIFRKGAKEFLEKMKKDEVPVIILSAGIGNVIERFLAQNNCYFSNMYIISNFIKFDKDGKMIKFNDNMIHTLNKTMKHHLPSEWSKKIVDKKYRLLMGDLIEDKNMIKKQEWNQTIAVGFLNKNIKENEEIYKENFDIVLTQKDASFDTLINLLLI